jgi:hypothetical protein
VNAAVTLAAVTLADFECLLAIDYMRSREIVLVSMQSP